jgi:hypothetical protein
VNLLCATTERPATDWKLAIPRLNHALLVKRPFAAMARSATEKKLAMTFWVASLGFRFNVTMVYFAMD